MSLCLLECVYLPEMSLAAQVYILVHTYKGAAGQDEPSFGDRPAVQPTPDVKAQPADST